MICDKEWPDTVLCILFTKTDVQFCVSLVKHSLVYWLAHRTQISRARNFTLTELTVGETWQSAEGGVGQAGSRGEFLRRGRQPEENISRAMIALSPRFLYHSSLMEKRFLAMWMWLCEGKLKEKIAYFRLPSASQKRACCYWSRARC